MAHEVHVRILAPVVHYGHVQLIQNQVLTVPKFFGEALIADDSAEIVSPKEFAALQAACSTPPVIAPVKPAKQPKIPKPKTPKQPKPEEAKK